MLLSIDIETYSSIDLTKWGVYRYVDAPDFKILLFAYAFDDESVEIVDFTAGEELPYRVRNALMSKDYIKTAFNANFEITCINKFFNINLDISQWRCTAVMALELGLPGRLGKVAEVLGNDEQKDTRGKKLINYFCKPCKPTKANDGRTRNLPEHNVEDWKIFKEYCIQDVETERAIRKRLEKFSITDNEQKLWVYDQRINSRGVRLDIKFIQNAISFNESAQNELIAKSKSITGLENTNSVAQLKKWVSERLGKNIEKLDKAVVEELIKNSDNTEVVKVLRLRQSLGKSSVAKYSAMINGVCSDNRLRGLLQFYGANRTGRWAGRIVQVHNLPQNHLPDLAEAKELVLNNDYDTFEMLYDVPKTLSELIRTSFIPSDGRRFIVADFSAIEARVVAYLAREQWRLDVFKNRGDIYCASASQMFGVPVEKHGINGHLRQKGKIAELALGYGGSVGALVSMGATKMGIPEEELQDIVDRWRASSPSIVRFWWEAQNCAMSAIKGHPSQLKNGIKMFRKSGILFIQLPSGRCLAYIKPSIGTNRFGGESITYMGMNQTTKKWERLETFGGKLVENIVQAFARDCLAENIMRLEDLGYEVNFHVHDEVILDVTKGEGSLDEVSKVMGQPIPWAPGLELRADGYECDFYQKD